VRRLRRLGFLLALAVVCRAARAAEELPPLRSDTDPTKPVLFSLRNEYYNLQNNAFANLSILRADRLVLENIGLPGGARGSLVRLDVPFETFYNGRFTRSGLSDIYAQALEIPSLHRGFTVAYGSGLIAPTAGDQALGAGKWQIAPAILPAQFLPQRRGLAYVKIQDFISFAGASDRPPVHILLVTPTVLYRLTPIWYTVVDGESATDMHDNTRTTLKSGLQLGVMFHNRWGAWLKVEVPWGEHRAGDWTLKATLFATRY
jgi:hypothetical protein